MVESNLKMFVLSAKTGPKSSPVSLSIFLHTYNLFSDSNAIVLIQLCHLARCQFWKSMASNFTRQTRSVAIWPNKWAWRGKMTWRFWKSIWRSTLFMMFEPVSIFFFLIFNLARLLQQLLQRILILIFQKILD